MLPVSVFNFTVSSNVFSGRLLAQNVRIDAQSDKSRFSAVLLLVCLK